ncbi:MAG: cyclic nucleotide-binding domain-containing protein, partial [Gammaproteobacteria bacterium]|nr:cyclic nucleotide-binding domain-containing protein [Gammaproteobacteria bacterium]
WLLAHALGQCLRHRYGRFGTDLGHEEQLANQFAAALTADSLTAQDRSSLIALLRRSLAVLAPTVACQQLAVTRYRDPLQAIGATGILKQAAVRGLELLEGLFAVPPEQSLGPSPRLPPAIHERLSQADSTIKGFEDAYAAGLARQACAQFGSMLIALESSERHYVAEFAQDHLGKGVALLPNIRSLVVPEAPQIRALYAAHRALWDACPALGRYFFKRYRASLLERFAALQARLPGPARRLSPSAWRLLESQDEEDAQTLNHLSMLAPPELKPLFPNQLANEPPRAKSAADGLIYETDVRLFRHATSGADDPAAAATQERLIQLNASELFRALPAELLIELTHCLHCVRVTAGHTLIRQGSPNGDVFIVVSGAFEVLHEQDGCERTVRIAGPGEVVGEMGFITGASRSATLRATEPGLCFVLRATTLKLFAYENPVLLMQMARVLASRLQAALAKNQGLPGLEDPRTAG